MNLKIEINKEHNSYSLKLHNELDGRYLSPFVHKKLYLETANIELEKLNGVIVNTFYQYSIFHFQYQVVNKIYLTKYKDQWDQINSLKKGDILHNWTVTGNTPRRITFKTPGNRKISFDKIGWTKKFLELLEKLKTPPINS